MNTNATGLTLCEYVSQVQKEFDELIAHLDMERLNADDLALINDLQKMLQQAKGLANAYPNAPALIIHEDETEVPEEYADLIDELVSSFLGLSPGDAVNETLPLEPEVSIRQSQHPFVQFLSSASNRHAVMSITQRVMKKIRPNEAVISPKLLDLFLDMLVSGFSMPAPAYHPAGGFGPTGLEASAVSAIVSAVLERQVVGRLGEEIFDEVDETALTKSPVIRMRELQLDAEIIRSVGGEQSVERIVQLTNQLVMEYLESD